MKTYNQLITKKNMPPNGVFIFGSNTEGRHRMGAAKVALENFGAAYGIPFGRQGQSYAIVTKDLTIKPYLYGNRCTIPKEAIELQVSVLYQYAMKIPGTDFYVAYSGEFPNERSLSGYTATELAQMFSTHKIPNNIIFEEKFLEIMTSKFYPVFESNEVK